MQYHQLDPLPFSEIKKDVLTIGKVAGEPVSSLCLISCHKSWIPSYQPLLCGFAGYR